jgi:hypothetical protein
MRERNYTLLVAICFLLIAAIVLVSCNSSSDASPDGKALLEDRCVECHNLSRVKSANMTREEWARNIDRMITLGAELSSEERDLLLDYLEATYP